MFDTEEKITALFVKLNKLTSLGQITWRVEDPPRSLSKGTDDYIPVFMSASYKGQTFGLYQQRYQSYDGDRDRFYWSERVAFAILDSEERVLWESVRYSSALADLFETARRKVANVEGILDDLLKDEDEM
ncbi:MAG: hypothetical protein ACK4NM_10070 [Hydrogenophaga sp.]